MARLRKAILWSVVALAGLTVAARAIVKPLRVITPGTFGLTCVTADLCVEDGSTAARAAQLRADALRFVAREVGPIKDPPRMLFCTTRDCFSRFGNPAVAALYVWGLDTLIINGTGWQDYILRHELIHHWQAERFGPVRAARLPRWYIEGMAYSISQDPRDPLPRTDIQGWRAQFEAWARAGHDWRQPPHPQDHPASRD